MSLPLTYYRIIPIISFNHFFVEPARITNPTQDSNVIIDREYYIGESALYTCDYEGFPSPTMRWYHNGRLLSNSSDNITYLYNNSVVIPSLQLSHSGVYQCIVNNTHLEDRYVVDSRTWILEVRAQSKLQ